MKKILFTFVAIISAISIVSAATYLIDKTGTLKNTVRGTTTTRNTIEGTSTFGDSILAKMLNVSNVNATEDGGIRVKIIAKKYNLGIVTNTEYMYIPIYPSTTTSSGALFTYSSSTNKVKIQWENWTGNTSFKARFIASNYN